MSVLKSMTYAGPIGEGPSGWKVVVQEATSLGQLQDAKDGRYPAGNGPFHVLRHDKQLWMSDTDTEKRDLLEPVWKIELWADLHSQGPKVLVHGLGLGLVVAAALRFGSAVEVVEIDSDLVEWMTPWLTRLARRHQGSLQIHVDDVLTRTWPVGSHWNIVWHDIWPSINEDNLSQMHQLHRSFGHRTDWQGSWARWYCEREKSNW